MRKPVIRVMGGSKATPSVAAMAFELGRLIAERGWILLNGGRHLGVMSASAKGARQAGGMVIGILPDKSSAKASPDLDIAIMTGMGEARNVINVLSSDVVIACPGKLGTRSEVNFALNAKRNVILLQFDMGDAYDHYQRRGLLHYTDSPEEAVELTADLLCDRDGT